MRIKHREKKMRKTKMTTTRKMKKKEWICDQILNPNGASNRMGFLDLEISGWSESL